MQLEGLTYKATGSGLTLHCGKALEPHPVSVTLVISRLEKSLRLEEERLNSANHGMMERSGLEGTLKII